MAWKLIGCPNCGGDDEPWFFKAKEPSEKPYEQECVKCQHTFQYDDADVVVGN